jgi:hypothetical protein
MVAAAANYVYRKKDSGASEIAAVLFLLAAVLPPFLVGILKAKYTIYAAYFVGAGIAFVLSELEVFIGDSSWVKNKKTWQSAVLYFGVFLLVMQFFHGGFASSLAIVNFQTRFQDDPLATQVRLQQICDDTKDSRICAIAKDPMAYASSGTTKQYDTLLCMLTALPDYKIYLDPGKSMAIYQAAGMRCNRLTDYWINSMEWIRYNTENDSRTTSWWDYGHWINYFGQKDAVLRNEHASTEMIGEVAFAYTEGNEADLIHFMKEHDSKYVLIDSEIVGGSGGFGGKFGALNYLGCAYSNQTDVSKSPGQSTCEADNLWETVYVSGTEGCRISDSGPNGTVVGAVAYTIRIGPPNGEWYYSPYYPGECTGTINDANTKYYCSYYVHLVPTYCAGNVELATGEKITGMYYLNETYPNGDLKINKGFPAYPFSVKNTYNAGDLTGVTMLYTKEKVWFENGEFVDGFSDHKNDFYDSNIYKGFVLGQIDGFDKVYDDGNVKIFKLKE